MSVCIEKDIYENNQFWEYCAKLDRYSPFTSNKITKWKLIRKIKLWNNRYRQRNFLANLDEHMLNDIGYTYQQARLESAKPFWK